MLTDILRWAAVLPGAIIGAALALFPLKLVLYQTLTGSGLVQPYPETPERLLTPLVFAAASVWAGARIAPKYKLKVAIALSCLWVLTIGGMSALILSGAHLGGGPLYFQYGGWSSLGALAGVLLGLLMVVRKGPKTKTGDDPAARRQNARAPKSGT